MPATILVVDDEPLNIELVTAILEHTYEVRGVTSSEAAYAVLARESVDLVILDVMMPRENGLDACRRIKAQVGRGTYLPVLLCTTLSDQQHRNAGLAAGADDFISKPFDRQELLLRVGAFLRLRHQERTIRAQLEALERVTALKDDLVSLLVHDLRNPLAGLLGALETIDDALAGEDATMLKNAIGAGYVLRDTIEDLLQIRLLEEDKLPLSRRPIAASSIVSAAFETLRGAAAARRVELRQHGDEAVVPVDFKLVKRAIENLVANAVRYSPAGAAVEVEHRVNDGILFLEVKDRGVGIPESKLSHLFSKYGGVDEEAQRTRRGFGLGLYLVDLVAQAHRGAVAVADRDGGGTTFRLVLPP